MRVLILGRGRVGRGLHHALSRTDHDVHLSSSRRPERALATPSDAVVLAVADSAYDQVAATIAPRLWPRVAVLHCSGSHPVSVLDACRAAGAATGAMHPLVSFTRRPPPLAGTAFVIDGAPQAVRAGRAIARAVGARPMVHPVHGASYHAAAALSANGAAALATIAVRVLERLGFSSRDATRAIAGLLRTVAHNVETVGVPDALSGPILRGDAETVTRHRRALSEHDVEALAAYDAVAPTILGVAKANGLSRGRVAKVDAALAAKPGRGQR